MWWLARAQRGDIVSPHVQGRSIHALDRYETGALAGREPDGGEQIICRPTAGAIVGKAATEHVDNTGNL